MVELRDSEAHTSVVDLLLGKCVLICEDLVVQETKAWDVVAWMRVALESTCVSIFGLQLMELLGKV